MTKAFESKQCVTLLKATGKKAKTLRELRGLIASVSHGSIVHHTHQYFLKGHIMEYTNDFAHWAGESLEESLPLPSLEQYLRHLVDKTKKEMDELVAEEKREGMEVKELLLEGKPAEEIEKVVREEKIDLLVLPSHEESRLEHFLFGRDNEDLMRRMPCSILFVKREPKPAPYPWPA